MNAARGIAALLLLWVYRLARAGVALLALAQLLGYGWATPLWLLLVAARLTWALRLAAFAGLIGLAHWPWWAALIGSMPRLLLVLPGLVRTALARVRHPRPLWPAPTGAPSGAPALTQEPR